MKLLAVNKLKFGTEDYVKESSHFIAFRFILQLDLKRTTLIVEIYNLLVKSDHVLVLALSALAHANNIKLKQVQSWVDYHQYPPRHITTALQCLL